MRRTKSYALLIGFGLLGLLSCEPEPELQKTADINFNLEYNVDGLPVQTDTILYTNAAGNNYSISKLQYYISDITFASYTKSYTDPNVHYIDLKDPSTSTISLSEIPIEKYYRISFKIGLNSEMNYSGSLDPTIENMNMGWPDMMGGGYHFLKMEGHFTDNTGGDVGYAMHIGTDPTLVNVSIDFPIAISYNNDDLVLDMNINQWFENPNTYDLNSGNYTMGDNTNMGLISQNGPSTFSIHR